MRSKNKAKKPQETARSVKRSSFAHDELLGSMIGKFTIIGEVKTSTRPEDWENEEVGSHTPQRQLIEGIFRPDARRLAAQRRTDLKGKRK
ncbi:MAG: hypothetical protein ROO76_00990 [Terriglobia bacterium]|nr:hypothetical protein [Terriglobia bacterium]